MVRPLDLGIFLPNAKGGAIMSTASPPQYNPTWELNKKKRDPRRGSRFSVLALDGQWRGFGGATNHWDYSLKSFTLMGRPARPSHRAFNSTLRSPFLQLHQPLLRK